MNDSKMRGFTIVELIIVMAVLAILVTISVVSYNGIQQKAYNTKMVNGVRQYFDAIEAYKIKNGAYPKTAIERDNPSAKVALTCLGVGYVGGGCGKVTGVDVYEDSHFNQQMSTLVEAPPALGGLDLHVQPETFTGAVYGIDHVSTSGTGYGRTLQWALTGNNADCKVPGAYSYAVSSTPPTTACEVLLEEVTR